MGYLKLAAYDTELPRARLAGQGMVICPRCDFCGRYRGQGKHTRCSKIKQQRGFKGR